MLEILYERLHQYFPSNPIIENTTVSSSISQVKAEAQKLIKRYNQLQAEAKTANSAEASYKVAEAEKLVSQISVLQEEISKLQAKDRETVTKKAIASAQADAMSATDVLLPKPLGLELEEVEKRALESRINRIEETQRKTRDQIDQLTRAKAELAKLKDEAGKNASTLAQERRLHEEKLQQEINKLIEKKEHEQVTLKKELENIKVQAVKEAEVLKVQRDAARAMMEKQKQIETEKILVTRRMSRKSHKGVWIGIGIGGLFSVMVLGSVAFLTPLGEDIWGSSMNKQGKELGEQIAHNNKINKKTESSVKSEPVFKPLATFQDRLTNGSMGPVMMKLPGGVFTMGSRNPSSNQDERPSHQVTLQSFSISKYEITFDEYDVFANSTGSPFPTINKEWGRRGLPVVNISWNDAVEYTKWLTEQSGHQYRLPSEREWEYAAAAGTEKPYWWGYNLGKNQANCAVCGSLWDGRQPAPIGSFPANAFGLHDTIGNVLEWTNSCYHPSYQGSPEFGQEWEGGDCSKRVVRSSSFNSATRDTRTTKRTALSPGSKLDTLGFRIVRID